jgi:hypothetical protein
MARSIFSRTTMKTDDPMWNLGFGTWNFLSVRRAVHSHRISAWNENFSSPPQKTLGLKLSEKPRNLATIATKNSATLVNTPITASYPCEVGALISPARQRLCAKAVAPGVVLALDCLSCHPVASKQSADGSEATADGHWTLDYASPPLVPAHDIRRHAPLIAHFSATPVSPRDVYDVYDGKFATPGRASVPRAPILNPTHTAF